jgi:phage gp36-like protein
MRAFIGPAAAALFLAAAPAQATETLTYTYDAKGRLVKVVHSGTVNAGVQTTYSHDKADNRKTTTTTGAP